MVTMPIFTLNQAAKACNKSKSAVLKAIKTGRLSAIKDDLGQWCIDASELYRCYPPNPVTTDQVNTDKLPGVQYQGNTVSMSEMLELLTQERERERAQLLARIESLENRLNEESAERRKLTALITHQPETPKAEQPTRSRLFEKLFGRK